jgi:DNA mismatch endonuclease (patch repair protein)
VACCAAAATGSASEPGEKKRRAWQAGLPVVCSRRRFTGIESALPSRRRATNLLRVSSWVSTEKGNHLRARRTRDTAPEVALRKAVHALGLRFRLHVPVLRGCTPDFVLPRSRVAVFVDGCYWHGCPQHSPREFKGPNAERWRQKIDANRARDRRHDEELAAAGWHVVRIWECEIKKDVRGAAGRVRSGVNTRRRD